MKTMRSPRLALCARGQRRSGTCHVSKAVWRSLLLRSASPMRRHWVDPRTKMQWTSVVADQNLPDGSLAAAASTAEVVLERLRSEANGLGRPEQRHATLDSMVEACNAIVKADAEV